MGKEDAALARLRDEEARAFGEGHAAFQTKSRSVEESPHLGLGPFVSWATKNKHF